MVCFSKRFSWQQSLRQWGREQGAKSPSSRLSIFSLLSHVCEDTFPLQRCQLFRASATECVCVCACVWMQAGTALLLHACIVGIAIRAFLTWKKRRCAMLAVYIYNIYYIYVDGDGCTNTNTQGQWSQGLMFLCVCVCVCTCVSFGKESMNR